MVEKRLRPLGRVAPRTCRPPTRVTPLGARLRADRLQLGLSQTALARATGVSPRVINFVEDGTKGSRLASVTSIVPLALHLGWSLQELAELLRVKA